MPVQHFGSGNLYGLVTSGGVQVPRKFGTLQDVTIDASFNVKELYGQNQFPVAIARGQGKVEGKAKFASITASVYNDLFWGQAGTTGQTLFALAEAAKIPASTPWTVTVANGAKFKDDLGVVYAASGIALTRVPSAPTVGQYSVNTTTGVYTFSTSDAGKDVLVDYTYSSSTSGSTTIVTNAMLGATPTFQLVLPMVFGGATTFLRFFMATSTKFNLATKQEDFVIPEFDLKMFCDPAGRLVEMGFSE